MTAMDKQGLEDLALSWGADFFGVADLAPFRGFRTLPEDLLDTYTRAFSLGVSLSRDVIEGLTDGPSPLYSHHYQAVNALLDQIALRLAGNLQDQGRRALPIPASQVLDETEWLGALSHKAVARMAGLGWQGKSLLLINPRVGPRLRLVTVLTDLDLPADQPLPNRCGDCEECAAACPAGAIKGVSFGRGYSRPAEAWDAKRCTEKMIRDFSRRPGVRPLICGLCIKVCPWGKPRTDANAGPPFIPS